MKSKITYHQLAAFIFITAFFAHTFNKYFFIAGYYTNIGMYAKNCENKARPQMHCNGKCQMMKKLQQEEKKDQENPNRKGDNKNEITLFSKSFFATVNLYRLFCLKKQYPSLQIQKETDRSFEVFHPPSLFVTAL